MSEPKWKVIRYIPMVHAACEQRFRPLLHGHRTASDSDALHFENVSDDSRSSCDSFQSRIANKNTLDLEVEAGRRPKFTTLPGLDERARRRGAEKRLHSTYCTALQYSVLRAGGRHLTLEKPDACIAKYLDVPSSPLRRALWDHPPTIETSSHAAFHLPLKLPDVLLPAPLRLADALPSLHCCRESLLVLLPMFYDAFLCLLPSL
ncbi:uncharacterized protein B0T15DRAFT_50688 [Chaetomium strumarium]|uniref:Uncharacterized protein n=1 Tax=Chaetomium strumarium TaxID=1170767 RepID=A0AAJ0M6P0_9PEZI|nr:hypothetical protein B0T15DRAFT_50688 [Chaetomium strumarium]